MHRAFATVRVRTTVFATLVVTAALLVGAVLLLVAQHRSLVAGLDQSVKSRAADVAGLARRRVLPTELTAAREDDAFTQVTSASGRVLARSENLRGEGRVVDAPPRPRHSRLVTRNIPALGGRFRIVAVGAETPRGDVIVYAGNSVETVEDATTQLATLLGIGLPLLVGLVALTTWRVTGRALRPVESIRAEVSEIGERDLHRRVPEPPTEDEVGRLARTMNAMLARLDDASDRQRRFVSDASHELQSPLTSLRARLEVNLGSHEELDWRANEAESLVEVTEMQRLVDDLLTLARVDAGVDRQTRVAVDVDDLILQEVERLRSRGQVIVNVESVAAGQVLGDPDQLRRAIRNVLDNAERYAAHAVSVSVGMTDATVEVRITDDGIGIPAEHRERIFERFARIDDARTRNGSSTGLGLAIAREIVTAHHGQIAVAPSDVGACFVLRLPAVEGSY